jgi:hypothetical protein
MQASTRPKDLKSLTQEQKKQAVMRDFPTDQILEELKIAGVKTDSFFKLLAAIADSGVLKKKKIINKPESEESTADSEAKEAIKPQEKKAEASAPKDQAPPPFKDHPELIEFNNTLRECGLPPFDLSSEYNERDSQLIILFANSMLQIANNMMGDEELLDEEDENPAREYIKNTYQRVFLPLFSQPSNDRGMLTLLHKIIMTLANYEVDRLDIFDDFRKNIHEVAVRRIIEDLGWQLRNYTAKGYQVNSMTESKQNEQFQKNFPTVNHILQVILTEKNGIDIDAIMVHLVGMVKIEIKLRQTPEDQSVLTEQKKQEVDSTVKDLKEEDSAQSSPSDQMALSVTSTQQHETDVITVVVDGGEPVDSKLFEIESENKAINVFNGFAKICGLAPINLKEFAPVFHPLIIFYASVCKIQLFDNIEGEPDEASLAELKEKFKQFYLNLLAAIPSVKDPVEHTEIEQFNILARLFSVNPINLESYSPTLENVIIFFAEYCYNVAFKNRQDNLDAETVEEIKQKLIELNRIFINLFSKKRGAEQVVSLIDLLKSELRIVDKDEIAALEAFKSHLDKSIVKFVLLEIWHHAYAGEVDQLLKPFFDKLNKKLFATIEAQSEKERKALDEAVVAAVNLEQKYYKELLLSCEAESKSSDNSIKNRISKAFGVVSQLDLKPDLQRAADLDAKADKAHVDLIKLKTKAEQISKNHKLRFQKLIDERKKQLEEKQQQVKTHLANIQEAQSIFGGAYRAWENEDLVSTLPRAMKAIQDLNLKAKDMKSAASLSIQRHASEAIEKAKKLAVEKSEELFVEISVSDASEATKRNQLQSIEREVTSLVLADVSSRMNKSNYLNHTLFVQDLEKMRHDPLVTGITRLKTIEIQLKQVESALNSHADTEELLAGLQAENEKMEAGIAEMNQQMDEIIRKEREEKLQETAALKASEETPPVVEISGPTLADELKEAELSQQSPPVSKADEGVDPTHSFELVELGSGEAVDIEKLSQTLSSLNASLESELAGFNYVIPSMTQSRLVNGGVVVESFPAPALPKGTQLVEDEKKPNTQLSQASVHSPEVQKAAVVERPPISGEPKGVHVKDPVSSDPADNSPAIAVVTDQSPELKSTLRLKLEGEVDDAKIQRLVTKTDPSVASRHTLPMRPKSPRAAADVKSPKHEQKNSVQLDPEMAKMDILELAQEADHLSAELDEFRNKYLDKLFDLLKMSKPKEAATTQSDLINLIQSLDHLPPQEMINAISAALKIYDPQAQFKLTVNGILPKQIKKPDGSFVESRTPALKGTVHLSQYNLQNMKDNAINFFMPFVSDTVLAAALFKYYILRIQPNAEIDTLDPDAKERFLNHICALKEARNRLQYYFDGFLGYINDKTVRPQGVDTKQIIQLSILKNIGIAAARVAHDFERIKVIALGKEEKVSTASQIKGIEPKNENTPKIEALLNEFAKSSGFDIRFEISKNGSVNTIYGSELEKTKVLAIYAAMSYLKHFEKITQKETWIASELEARINAIKSFVRQAYHCNVKSADGYASFATLLKEFTTRVHQWVDSGAMVTKLPQKTQKFSSVSRNLFNRVGPAAKAAIEKVTAIVSEADHVSKVRREANKVLAGQQALDDLVVKLR